MESVYYVNPTRAHVNYAVNAATPSAAVWTPMNSGINFLAGMEFCKKYNNDPMIDQIDRCISNLINLRNSLI
jgi:hypothetical protein